MKVNLLSFFIIISFPIHLSAQKVLKMDSIANHTSLVIGDNFRGIDFNKNYDFVQIFIHDKIKNMSTPTENDIKKAEILLQTEIKNQDLNSIFQRESFIRKNIKRYIRQYFGYINEKGEKIIFINCFFIKRPHEISNRKWLQDNQMESVYNGIFIVYDGGDDHWKVNVNLTSGKLNDLDVNGIG